MKKHQSPGVALVFVLGMLVLLSVIVVAFISNVTTDLGASKSYEEQANTRALADSTVGLVIAQIREASTQGSKAWISQPGLIRTFSGSAPDKAYKLYSDDTMQESGAFDPAVHPPAVDWSKKPNLYTDLNSPIFKDGKASFPIIDGNSLKPGQAGGGTALIYDDDGNGVADIEGFSIDPTGTGYQSSQPLSVDNNPVPMPVKWLYLLRDGTFLSAETVGSSLDVKIGSGSSSAPDRNNPVIARVAFWTDDESAKVNINTASEGTYGDTPVGNSRPSNSVSADPATRMFEWTLADFQGAQREYQRYPGHPATTCLSPIFGASFPNLARPELVKTLTEWAPRVSDDGNSSKGGVQRALKPVVPDADRLYATTDELVFDPLRVAHALPAKSDPRPIFERARFFLTTNSRAPEENLFNKPRIAIWPIHTDPAKRTALDRLFAFCSTVGAENGRPFYFSRQNPASPTEDWSSRNEAIYRYLQTLTDRPFPGFAGGSFAAKYGADRDQILTEIFEYIRCTNLADVSEGRGKSYTPTTANDPVTKRGQVIPIEPGNGTRGFGRIATISELGLILIKVDDRNAGGAAKATRINYTAPPPLGTGVCLPASETLVEWSLMPKLNSPMAGYSAMANDLRIKFTNVDLKIDGQTVGGTTFPDLYDTGRIGGSTHESKLGGNIGITTLFEAKDVRNAGNPGAPADSMFPTGLIKLSRLAGQAITVSGTVDVEIWAPAVNGTKLQTIRFKIPPSQMPVPEFTEYASNRWMGTMRSSTRQAYSNNTVTFTYQLQPLPKTSMRIGQSFVTEGSAAVYRTRFLNTNDEAAPTQDTIRSLSPTGALGASSTINGEMRFVAMSKDIPETTFELTKRRDGSLPQAADQRVHSLRSGTRKMFGDAGRLFARTGSVDYNNEPDIPSGVLSTGGAGDWDNGPGLMLDGALFNKADEGGGIRAATDVPYLDSFYSENYLEVPLTFFSPNRQVASPVVFGSLPTGFKSGKPWRTLLFRPANLLNTPHPAGTGLPDHLFLDLFWMPVVEPYPISEPFSTAGKINLNYQIAPFTYIKRDTGLRAVMKSVMITALNPDQNKLINTYKNPGSSSGSGVVTRRGIDLDSTLRLIEQSRFKAGTNKPFIAASEICDIPLVPKDAPNHANAGVTASMDASAIRGQLASFWSKHALTGDNSLERPYAHIYPRVTTRSNTYTVHLRVQTLKKITTDPDQHIFKDVRDQVTGEFRGSFVIERYLDPNVQEFDESDPNAVLGPYRFRVVSSKQFGL